VSSQDAPQPRATSVVIQNGLYTLFRSENLQASAEPKLHIARDGPQGAHGTGSGARERILASAYELFSRRGIRAVGVNEIIERAGVAKATLYEHFPSKDDLALAFLQRRERLWTHEWVENEARRRGTTPEEGLFAIFDTFDEWFRQDGFEACSFINVLLEMGNGHPLGQASAAHLENIRSVVRTLAEEAGLRDLEEFAHAWHILMKGSIVAAAEGDRDAAQRAKSIARLVIEQYRAEPVASGHRLA
jgi:AcrR family transcriptional regulator